MIVSTPCHSQSCAARLTLEFPIELFSRLDIGRRQRGWKKISLADDKEAWMCRRCSYESS